MPDNITFGTSGDDNLSGGNGKDTIYGLDGDDIIHGGNGVDTLFGDGGNDQLFGDNGSDDLTGGAGDDLLDGLAGVDTAYFSGEIDEYTFLTAAGYLHVIHQGGAGADGHDRLTNVERLVFADRVIDLNGQNAPIAVDDHVLIDEDTGTYSSGAARVTDNDFDFEGDALTVTAATLTGTYGTLTLNADGTYSYTLNASAQQLAAGQVVQDSFNYTVSDNDGSDSAALVFDIAGLNDGPTANADVATGGENETILIDVLANDSDIDNGAVLTVTSASAPAGQGSASVVGNLVQFDPGTDFESLAVGESEDVTVGYTIEDEHGAGAASTVTVTVTGENDAPVANPDTDTAGENETILIGVAANDTDVDNGAVLTVTDASAPVGQGTATPAGSQVEFDPGTDFDDLAVGESEEVIVDYTIEDEHGASSSSTATVTVIGENDAPVANPDSVTTSEDTVVTVEVLANDTDADNGAIVVVTGVSAPAGQGSATIDENQVRFDPGADFDYLAAGESATVIVDYTIEDEWGATSASTVTITVDGEDDTPATPTEGSDTLFGTSGDDTIDALGGDDTVFGRAGNDVLLGSGGADQLYGEGGNDSLDGGSDDDFLSGGDGDDTLAGQAGNDTLVGEAGEDQLTGGDGFDFLLGDADDDVLAGGNDDDYLSGGDGSDQLTGDAGNDFLSGESGDDQLSGGGDNDSLDGGDGDDTLTGGDGDDFLADAAGTNSLYGGLGNDTLYAGSADGAQTLDGGDGNDTISHSGRSFASTVATGAGSDTFELLNADVGTVAIVVTDFTPGAGGDRVRLSGGDAAVLSLLTGWDGSSNPFGSDFLRLEQNGDDTELQWDRDGATGGPDWETLVVFENTDAGDFTEANFDPAYHPDGSPPAGDTITGTADGETLTGTIGSDTIDALAGDDTVFGQAGADLIDGGDGNDFLLGEADDDTIDGGNDDDYLKGDEGNDQLSGEAGNDALFGDAGDDQLSGGDGTDTLDGGEGSNAVNGDGGDDFLVGGQGTDTLDGGADNDTLRHHGRNFAGTITTGTGSDTVELIRADLGTEAITVTDFTTGGGGDVVRLSGDEGSLLSLLTGWDGSSNPFGDFLRLQQNGSDTELQWDPDGTAGGSSWETLIVFTNATVGDFTEANFVPGYDPDGTPPAGETITGTADGETLTGTIGSDTINALGGNDTVFGQAGADLIDGGDGFDFLLGEGDDDTIEGGNDDDYLYGGDGEDQLSGGAGADVLLGDSGDDALTGGDGDDNLDGGDDDDTLDGGLGEDFLYAGRGADVLTGGGGGDAFYFQFADQGPDEVTDFTVGGDKIYISADGFGDSLVAGTPVSLVSGSDPAASGASGQFLYDTDDGRLLWDVDGTGSEAAVLVATFSSLPSLTAADFLVV